MIKKKKRRKKNCKNCMRMVLVLGEGYTFFSSYSQHNDKPITSSEIFIIGDQVCFHKMNAQIKPFTLFCVKKFLVRADDLIQLRECGRGAYGVVYAMKHRETGTIMAVKVLTMQCYIYTYIFHMHVCVVYMHHWSYLIRLCQKYIASY